MYSLTESYRHSTHVPGLVRCVRPVRRDEELPADIQGERELLLPYSAPPKSSVQFERREFNYACSNERGPLFLLYCSVTHSPFPRSFLSFPLIYLNASLETRESGNNGQTPRVVGGREGGTALGRSVGHWGFKRSNSTAPAVINNRKVPLPSALPSLCSINDIATAAKTVARSPP